MATIAVFSIPDLVETIILSLPLRSIILAREVCRAFKNIVDDTRSIQRALFLKSTSSEVLSWHSDIQSDIKQLKGTWKTRGDQSGPTRYPILNPFFPITVNVDQDLYLRQWDSHSPYGRFMKGWELIAFRETQPNSANLFSHFPDATATDLQDFHERFIRSEGLFKHMQLTHPPLDRAYCDYSSYGIACVGSGKHTVTIGKLIEDNLFHVRQWVGKRDVPTSSNLQGGHRIAVLAKMVDEITGHEMLAILDSDMEKLDDNLFVMDHFSRKATFRVQY